LRRCQQSEADDETTRRSAAGVARPDAGVRGAGEAMGSAEHLHSAFARTAYARRLRDEG